MFLNVDVPAGSSYNLQILYVSEADQGFYECSIAGTNQSVISRLDVQGQISVIIIRNIAQNIVINTRKTGSNHC